MNMAVIDIVIEKAAVSVKDAATYLDVAEKTVWRLIYARQIESFKIRGLRKIRLEEWKRFMQENTIPRAK
jgi:excisionase family DNA binding protein